MTAKTQPLDPLLRRPAVEAVTGLSTVVLYRAMREAGFPKPLQLTPDTVAWRQSEIAKWIKSRPRAAI